MSALERHQRIVEQAVYTPVRQGDIVAETVARLGQAIGMGLLRPGDRLPSEARLAADLGISPVSLRSALNMLRGAGVLETSRGRGGGTVVTADASALPLARTGRCRRRPSSATSPTCAAWSRAAPRRSPPSGPPTSSSSTSPSWPRRWSRSPTSARGASATRSCTW